MSGPHGCSFGIDVGSTTLKVVAVDTDGAIVASHVELWRIDAPGNEHWTGGDQLQAQAFVPIEGWLFTRLPEGRYRLVCHAQVFDEAPLEVVVLAPRTRLDVPIRVPRSFRIRVAVRDRFGRLVPSVFLGSETTSLALDEPWRFERAPRDPNQVQILEDIEIASESIFSSEGPQPAEGFDLGSYREADRGARRRLRLVLKTLDGATVKVRVPTRSDRDLDLVAVAVPASDVAAGVRLPGGGLAQARVSVTGWARPRVAGLPGGGWERAEVEIQARQEGYRPASLTWTAETGELPWITLEPGG